MNKVERGMKIFLSVRKELYKEKPINSLVMNLAYKHPFKFYRQNGKKGSLRILREEADKIIRGIK